MGEGDEYACALNSAANLGILKLSSVRSWASLCVLVEMRNLEKRGKKGRGGQVSPLAFTGAFPAVFLAGFEEAAVYASLKV